MTYLRLLIISVYSSRSVSRYARFSTKQKINSVDVLGNLGQSRFGRIPITPTTRNSRGSSFDEFRRVSATEIVRVLCSRRRFIATDKTLAEVSEHGNEANGRKLNTRTKGVDDRADYPRWRQNETRREDRRRKRSECNFAKCRERRIVPFRPATFPGTGKTLETSWSARDASCPRIGRTSVRTYHHIAAIVSATTWRRRRRRRASIQDLWHYQVKYSEHWPLPEKWRRRSQGTCDDPPPLSCFAFVHPPLGGSIYGNDVRAAVFARLAREKRIALPLPRRNLFDWENPHLRLASSNTYGSFDPNPRAATQESRVLYRDTSNRKRGAVKRGHTSGGGEESRTERSLASEITDGEPLAFRDLLESLPPLPARIYFPRTRNGSLFS